MSALEKCRLGRVPSVFFVLMLAFALLAAVGWAVSVQLVEILVRLPDYKVNIHAKVEAIRYPGNGSLGKATASVNDISKELIKELSAASETAGNTRTGLINGS